MESVVSPISLPCPTVEVDNIEVGIFIRYGET